VGKLESGSFFAAGETLRRLANPATVVADTSMLVRAATRREFESLVDLVPRLHAVCKVEIQRAEFDHEDLNASLDCSLDFVDGSGLSVANVMLVEIADPESCLDRLGDSGWGAITDVYAGAVRREVVHHRGRLVQLVGGRSVAWFDCAGAGVRCAVAIRDSVSEHGIAVRSAIYGPAVRCRGDEASGSEVHLAEQICRMAYPGEVFVSRVLTQCSAEDRGASNDMEVDGWLTMRGASSSHEVARAGRERLPDLWSARA
jgi:class 3 adenylate cyclase